MRTYNSEAFLAEAIESVVAQTFPEWELIISDDGSTDRTLSIAGRYGAKDPRIRALIHSTHLGPSGNGNRCLQAARYPWIAVLDSDDVALPDRLEITLGAARLTPEVVLWGGGAILIDRWGRRLRRAHVGPTSMDEYRKYRKAGRIIFVLSPTVMFRRDLALELGGYDDAMYGAEDVDLMTKLAERGPVIALNQDLGLYRVHGSSISSVSFDVQQRLFDFLDLRTKLRLAGSDITLEHYLEVREDQPTGVRARQWVRDLGRRKYRDTVVHMAERRYAHAAAAGALAMLCDPSHTLRRLRNRMPGLGLGA
jgi:glycosyltransferase involved in cell wall biosynthesis